MRLLYSPYVLLCRFNKTPLSLFTFATPSSCACVLGSQ
uniref:Uncharacterized protein n=1 Tax=Anguilla anguilla TaxID=7936 RepID=A0A0E9QYZ8_ANGAN